MVLVRGSGAALLLHSGKAVAIHGAMTSALQQNILKENLLPLACDLKLECN